MEKKKTEWWEILIAFIVSSFLGVVVYYGFIEYIKSKEISGLICCIILSTITLFIVGGFTKELIVNNIEKRKRIEEERKARIRNKKKIRKPTIEPKKPVIIETETRRDIVPDKNSAVIKLHKINKELLASLADTKEEKSKIIAELNKIVEENKKLKDDLVKNKEKVKKLSEANKEKEKIINDNMDVIIKKKAIASIDPYGEENWDT